MTIVVLLILWSQNLTYSGFFRLQHDLWRLDDLSTLSSCFFLASSTVWKSKRIEIQSKFGLFQFQFQYDDRSITYMKWNFTFVSGFNRVQRDIWMDDLVTTLASCLFLASCFFLASSTVWKSKRIEIQSKFGLFWQANMTNFIVVFTYNMKWNFTFVSGFNRLQPDLWMDDLVTTLFSL